MLISSPVVVASLRLPPAPPAGTPRTVALALASAAAVEVILDDDASPVLLDALHAQPWCLRAERRWAVSVAHDVELNDVRERLGRIADRSADTLDDALGTVTLYLFRDPDQAEKAAACG